MGTSRSSTAIVWLSLFLHLLTQTRISNAGQQRKNGRNNGESILLEEIVLAREGNATKLLGAAAVENPSKVNEQLLSLINGTSDLVFPNYDPSKDQTLAQSEAVIVSLDDAKDLENLDHVLTFSEYESQKIDTRKDKRKILDDLNKDSVQANGQIKNTESTLAPYLKPYYDVPRGFQSTKRSFYQEGHRPVTSSYRKVSQPVDQTDLDAIVVNTETPNRRFTIGYQVSPRFYKPEEEFTSSSVEIPKPTYRLPTRRIKNNDFKAKENVEKIETSVDVHQKPRKSKKKVKNSSIVTVPVVTTPVSVYNYTVARRRTNEYKPLVQSATIQPVAVQKNNNIVYQTDAVDVKSQTVKNHQKPISRTDGRLSLLQNYDVAPRPFSYTINHAGNVEKPQSISIDPVTPKNIALTRESPVVIDLKPNPAASYKDRISHYDNVQESDYKYKKPSSTVKPEPVRERFESSSEETNSKANLRSKESEDSVEDVEESIERPQRRKDSYEVSEAASLEDDSDASDDADYSDRYEHSEQPKKRPGYYNDYDKRHVRQSEDLERHERDRDRSIDVDYEETKHNQDQVNEEYAVKENLPNGDQNKESAHDYGHSEKSDGGGGGGHGGGGSDHGGGGGGHGGDGGGNQEFTKGGKVEQDESHYQKHGNKGEKAYKSWHEHDKAEKGHHDKEEHSKEYDEKDGEKKEHEEDGGYHEEYHKDEKGQKEAEFNEKGEHKKGHSTKGEHSVHKKDEYEKKTEFFDEYHEDDDMEKDGEFYTEHEAEHGGKTKSGHHEESDEEDKQGKMKKYEESEYHREKKGKDDEEGQESHYDHEEKYGKKGAHESGKKWMMEHGGKDGQDGGAGSGNGGGDKHGR